MRTSSELELTAGIVGKLFAQRPAITTAKGEAAAMTDEYMPALGLVGNADATRAAAQPTQLAIADIRIDGGTQPRDHINEDVAKRYADDMVHGAEFPPVVVFFDGADYWLADGFHRRLAAVGCDHETIAADVRQGTRRDAVLHSVGANATHGYPRSNADKRRAVETLLTDDEWSAWSDREIARQCGVSNAFVSRLRPADTVNGTQYHPRTFVHPKTGQPTQMRTANIGKSHGEAPVIDGTPSGREQMPDLPPSLDPRKEMPETDRTGPLRPNMTEATTIWLHLDQLAEALRITPAEFLAGLPPAEAEASRRNAENVASWLSPITGGEANAA